VRKKSPAQFVGLKPVLPVPVPRASHPTITFFLPPFLVPSVDYSLSLASALFSNVLSSHHHHQMVFARGMGKVILSFLPSFLGIPSFLDLPSFLPSLAFLPSFLGLPSFLDLPSFRDLPSFLPPFFDLPSFLGFVFDQGSSAKNSLAAEMLRRPHRRETKCKMLTFFADPLISCDGASSQEGEGKGTTTACERSSG
jgi:hypothetical protein